MKQLKSLAKHGQSQQMGEFRIIGGRHRSRKLHFIPIDGLRPTPDKVRETLFNWLQNVNNFHCLDLYAGSGALGLEALSRGAAHCCFVEKNHDACQAINRHLVQLENDGSTINQALPHALNAFNTEQPFDLVFLDPPYALKCISKHLQQLKDLQLLNNDAWIYIETASNQPATDLPKGFNLHREKQQGQVRYSLLQYSGSN